jgi:CHASE3 domain sensor protein
MTITNFLYLFVGLLVGILISSILSMHSVKPDNEALSEVERLRAAIREVHSGLSGQRSGTARKVMRLLGVILK